MEFCRENFVATLVSTRQGCIGLILKEILVLNCSNCCIFGRFLAYTSCLVTQAPLGPMGSGRPPWAAGEFNIALAILMIDSAWLFGPVSDPLKRL